MKKLENFSWQMWQIYALAALVIFLVAGTCSFFFTKETAYVAKEQNYVYKGKNQRLTNYTTIGETEPEFPMIALSFKESDGWSYYDFAVGRKFLAFQDSKQYGGRLKAKDKEEYFRIRYYKLGQEQGDGQTIDVLKLVQDMGYVTIEGEMDNLMYSDGKDEYVKIQIKDNDEIYVNLTSKKATKKQPKEEIRFGYGGFYRVLSSPTFITEAYKDDRKNVSIYWPTLFSYKKNDYQSRLTDSDSKPEDSLTLSILKKYGFIVVLKENMTLNDSITLTKMFFPDADSFYWSIDEKYTKSGKEEIIRTEEDFKQVIKEEAIEKEFKD
ncbi:putative lipoprotein [Streptococcus sanguinis SK150]|uniref:Putative lipoprotein n=1 Tax=Streptococcus sanguinis SK150 TaxID=888811 RepID=F0IPW5_STRSA|nr:hypothetical protein [Streptococcus sanguinis]EGD35605.1 putative lipoprotein [Streptococcus sanguinis SK150]MBZ2057208.1 hypothetical protein [Streptococcus sanguinis]MBZ2066622.1 hypothetical protein [Streptococcus sanguinis]